MAFLKIFSSSYDLNLFHLEDRTPKVPLKGTTRVSPRELPACSASPEVIFPRSPEGSRAGASARIMAVDFALCPHSFSIKTALPTWPPGSPLRIPQRGREKGIRVECGPVVSSFPGAPAKVRAAEAEAGDGQLEGSRGRLIQKEAGRGRSAAVIQSWWGQEMAHGSGCRGGE